MASLLPVNNSLHNRRALTPAVVMPALIRKRTAVLFLVRLTIMTNQDHRTSRQC